MIPEQIEHLGIAVPSIEEVLPFYEQVLGLKCYAIEEVADQKVKTAFLKVGEVKLELLEPTSPDSTVAKFLEKNGGKCQIHHIAYKVKEKGVRLIDETPRKGAEGLTIAFLHPKSSAGILTELCEKK